jgi:hypothetical protein
MHLPLFPLVVRIYSVRFSALCLFRQGLEPLTDLTAVGTKIACRRLSQQYQQHQQHYLTGMIRKLRKTAFRIRRI